MALRELVTQLRYELKDGNLKKYVEGYRVAEKQINAVAKAATTKLNAALGKSTGSASKLDATLRNMSPAMQALASQARVLQKNFEQSNAPASRLLRGVSRLKYEAREFAIGLRQGARQGYGEVLRQMDRVEAKQRRINREARSSRSRTRGQGAGEIGGMIQGLIGLASGRALMNASDEWAGARGRVGLQTPDAAVRDRSVEFLYRTAHGTGQQYSSLADTFVSMARSREAIGLSNDQTLMLSNTISKLMTIGGGSAASQDAALVQFGQAMNTGVLRGEELNSILEQAPRLAKAIADALGTNVGKLKELGEEGKITAKAIANGLLRQTQQVDEEFAKLPMTFSRSMTQIRNNFVRRAGELNQQYGIAEKFNRVAQVAIQNMGQIGAALGVIAGGYALRFVFKSLAGFAVDIGKAFAMIGRAGRPAMLFFNRLARGKTAQAFAKLGPLGIRLLKVMRGLSTAVTAFGVLGAGAFALIAGALVAAGLLVYRYWEPIKAFFVGLWRGLVDGMQGVGAQLQIAFAPLGPVFAQLGQWLGDAWRWFVKLIDPANATAEEISSAAGAGKVFGEAIAAAIRLGINILGFFIDRFVAFGKWLGESAGWIVITFGKAWDGVRSGVSRLWDWITSRFSAGWSALTGMLPGWVKSGIQVGASGAGFGAVSPSSVVNAGRSAVNQNITQTASVQVTAPPGGSPASFGAAAQRGTSKAFSGLQYQLPTAVEAF